MACYNDKKVLPLSDFSQTDSFDSRRTANGEKILSPSFALVEKIKGKTVNSTNLIPFPYSDWHLKTGNSFELEGLIWTVNDNGSITVVGTVTGASRIILSEKILVQKGKTYTLSMSESKFADLKLSLDFIGKKTDGTTIAIAFRLIDNFVTFTVADDYEDVVSVSLSIKRSANNVDVNATLFPILAESETVQPYTPYFTGLKNATISGIKSANSDNTEESTFTLSESYELGEWDSINPIEKTITRGTKTITFNGTENWALSANKYFYLGGNPKNATPAVGISTPYNYKHRYDEICIFVEETYLFIGEALTRSFNNDIASWKAHLAELANAGNPLTIAYELLESITETVEDLPRGYTAHKDGTETYLAGETDNSEWGAIPEFTLNYPKIMKEGTFNG